MKLYQLPQSNHCLNVRLVAHEVGEKLELINVDFFGGETQKPEYLRKNPPIALSGDARREVMNANWRRRSRA